VFEKKKNIKTEFSGSAPSSSGWVRGVVMHPTTLVVALARVGFLQQSQTPQIESENKTQNKNNCGDQTIDLG